ncbi:hypothetical protein [Kribbella sp. C-35]|uniref:hypothetical protein n=1 Tax=Kribbella sp. C-35 TaxID=2789276 RepID=UPI00397BC769
MSRPPLPIGTWGSISTKVIKTDKNGKPVKHQSQTKFRDHDGHVRQVSAVGTSKTGAENALKKKLQDRARTNQSGELTAMHKVNHLLEVWEKRFGSLVADGTRSPTSLDTYRRALKNHVRPAFGAALSRYPRRRADSSQRCQRSPAIEPDCSCQA